MKLARVPWIGGPDDGRIDPETDVSILEDVINLAGDGTGVDVLSAIHTDGKYRLERDGKGGYQWRWISLAPFPATGRDEGPEA